VSTTTGFEKAFISFRVGVPLWKQDNRFDELLGLFEKYKGVTDEVAFFTSTTHPCLPIEEIRARAGILAKRMVEVRKFGYRTGINILATVGHHNENLANSLSGDYTPMTNLDGELCLGSRCSNDPKMQGYIRELYQIITRANPDFIWIDDDVRFGHMPIGQGCFCEHCLERFAKKMGRRYSRAELKTAFNEGAIDQKLDLRKKWLEHNRQTISDLMTLIEKTVHEISPKMSLGFMTGDRFYEGYDFDRWAEILAGPNGTEVMWRPGGGFYEDNMLCGFVSKSHDIGRQISTLPDFVRNIQSEIENFPYQQLKKSRRTAALESASYIAAGCTGTAFNVLTMYDEPLEEYQPLVAELHKSRPFYDLLVKNFGRLKPQGIYTGWNKDVFAAGNLSQGDWFAGDVYKLAGGGMNELFEIGLPAAYSIENAQTTVLTGEVVRSLSPENIRKIFSGGVYLDGGALVNLNQMGYNELTGFEVEKFYEADCVEQLVEHPLNGKFAGRDRDNRQSFLWWNVPAAALTSTSKKAQTLSRLVDYANKEVASCTCGIYENNLGGRVCAAGYFPWTFLQNYCKASQMKNLFRWLSKDTLLAYVSSLHKMNLWTRQTSGGGQAIALINSSLDPAVNAELMIKTDRKEISVYDMNCGAVTVSASSADGGYQKFILPEIPAWQMRLVCTK
jgi:hypothetical protein